MLLSMSPSSVGIAGALNGLGGGWYNERNNIQCVFRISHQVIQVLLYLSLGRVPLRSDLGSSGWKDTVFVALGVAVLMASCC